MPRYSCPKCQVKVQDKGKDDAIGCDVCSKWYHLSCSELTKTQFQTLCKVKSFEWICPKCSSDECFKCEKIFRLDKKESLARYAVMITIGAVKALTPKRVHKLIPRIGYVLTVAK